jgi:prepilin-type N-terminal cleavage/methylation domain-containing protein
VDDDGFTLVELMVAIVVIGLVAMSFLGLTVSTLSSARWHEARAHANQFAQDALEKIVAQPWSSIGLYAADTGYTATGNGGETTVTLTASPRAASVPLPLAVTVSGGISYSIRTDITWRDDASDGVGAADANGNTNDMKHVAVSLTWVSGTRTGTLSLDDLRSPTATEVTPSGATALTVTVSAPATQLLSATGFLASTMTVTATMSKTVASATLTFPTRSGVQTVVMGGSGTAWTATLPTTTGPFDTVPTTFSVAATTASASASGKATVQMVLGTSASTITVSAAPSQTLTATGGLSSPITVSVTGSAPISAGTVTYPLHTGSTTRALSGGGTSWSAVIPADASVFDPGTETFTVQVTFADGTTKSGLASLSLFSASLPPDVTALVVNSPYTAGGTTQGFCVSTNNFTLYTATTVDATVFNVATTDTVRLTAPAITTVEFAMTYLLTNADGSMVFRYTTPAGQALPNATTIQLKAYALKTISGQQYRDDFLTNPLVPIQIIKKTSCV